MSKIYKAMSAIQLNVGWASASQIKTLIVRKPSLAEFKMPKVFISYSHDDESHKEWVRLLAERLIAAGIEVTLDQWDLRLGEDVASFMETGIRTHDRVVVVCSDTYVKKANDGKGGVGYEKQIVTAELVTDLGTNKFIPVIRRNPDKHVPAFLGYRLYLDFDDDSMFDIQLDSLQREVYQVPSRPKPALGTNPYASEVVAEDFMAAAALTSPRTVSSAVSAGSIEQFRALLRKDSDLMDLDEWISKQVVPIRDAFETTMASIVSQQPTTELIVATTSQLESIVSPLVPLMAIGGKWSSKEQAKVFGRILKRLSYSAPVGISSWYETWMHVARMPYAVVSSAWMLGVVDHGSYECVAPVLIDTKIHNPIRSEDQPALIWLYRGAPFSQEWWKELPQKDRLYFPFSAFLEEILQPAAKCLSLDEAEYVRQFDRTEAFLACLYASVERNDKLTDRVWAPLGSFVWRSPQIFVDFRAEIEAAGESWPPIGAGLLGASKASAMKIVSDVEQFVGRVRDQRGIF